MCSSHGDWLSWKLFSFKSVIEKHGNKGRQQDSIEINYLFAKSLKKK